MRNERFFALEGLDGVGKSTIVAMLRGQGYSVITTPPDIFKRYRLHFENKDLRIRFLYYLFGVVYAGMQANQLKRTQDVVSDRYLLTTVAAHEAMGISRRWLTLCNPLLQVVEKPSNTFLITCDEAERMQRLMSRGGNSVDLKNLEINSKIMEGYHRWSEELGYKLTIVDTTHILPDQVALLIEQYIANG